jgi:hypothetical protein
MTDLRAAHLHETPSSNDVQELLDRIAELEQRLKTRTDAANKRAGAANPRLLAVTAGLTAANVVIAYPAYLTVRRWYRWWQ